MRLEILLEFGFGERDWIGRAAGVAGFVLADIDRLGGYADDSGIPALALIREEVDDVFGGFPACRCRHVQALRISDVESAERDGVSLRVFDQVPLDMEPWRWDARRGRRNRPC